jgi:hypothetical protein
MSDNSTSDARIVIELRPLRAGVSAGMFGVLFVAIGYAIEDHKIDDVTGTVWVYLLMAGLIFSYALAGYGAGRQRPAMPLTHGILAGLGTFAGWMVLRALIVSVRDSGHAIAWSQIATNLLLGSTFGMFGSMFATRHAPFR